MILIADDNQLMRRMIRTMVEDLDPQIIECAEGGEALSLFESHRPDWVLMDVSMRPIDGLTATRRIIGQDPSARVVIVTEHDDAATRTKAFEAGACAFVAKDELTPLRTLIGNDPVRRLRTGEG